MQNGLLWSNAGELTDSLAIHRPPRTVTVLERVSSFEPSVVDGRFMIHVRHERSPWIVIVEPDIDARRLVVVTVYEVSQ
jgi:hypothetical protein